VKRHVALVLLLLAVACSSPDTDAPAAAGAASDGPRIEPLAGRWAGSVRLPVRGVTMLLLEAVDSNAADVRAHEVAHNGRQEVPVRLVRREAGRLACRLVLGDWYVDLDLTPFHDVGGALRGTATVRGQDEALPMQRVVFKAHPRVNDLADVAHYRLPVGQSIGETPVSSLSIGRDAWGAWVAEADFPRHRTKDMPLVDVSIVAARFTAAWARGRRIMLDLALQAGGERLDGFLDEMGEKRPVSLVLVARPGDDPVVPER